MLIINNVHTTPHLCDSSVLFNSDSTRLQSMSLALRTLTVTTIEVQTNENESKEV